MNKAITEGVDEVYFVLSWSEGIPFRAGSDL